MASVVVLSGSPTVPRQEGEQWHLRATSSTEAHAVDYALSRIIRAGGLRRVTRGLHDYPRIDRNYPRLRFDRRGRSGRVEAPCPAKLLKSNSGRSRARKVAGQIVKQREFASH